MRITKSRFALVVFSAIALAACAQTAGVGSGDVSQLGDQFMTAKQSGRAGSLPSLEGYAAKSDVENIYFAFDKSILSDHSITVLTKNAEWFKKHQGAMVLIEGYADERGTNEYNLALGERRAKAARDFLFSLGISHSRINQISYGEERPMCKESNEECWAHNRRDHFLVKEN